MTGKKKFYSSVWRVRDRYYDRKIKKVPVVCLAGRRSLLRPEKKKSIRLSGGCAIVVTTGKEKFQSSVWRVRDRYYDQKIKKFQLSVWRVRDRYYDRKKKVLVICLAGAQLLLRPEKKDTVVCLAGA